jgi:hypothetical protein
MGQIPQSVRNEWGVCRRLTVQKDAGEFHPKWGEARIYFLLRKSYSESERKENAMNGSIIILTLLAFRLVLPIVLVLSVGEWARRREANYWLK